MEQLPSFGHFQALSLLGEGGMGLVYLALHPALGYEVAVKTLRPRTTEARRVRFQREIQALSHFHHPGLVEVLEVGETPEGVPWFAMRRVQGGSLEERLRVSSLTPLEAYELGLALTDALQAAHETGAIHRDLKPDNVLCGPNGYVVTDFGLTKSLTETDEQVLSKTGTLQGTPGYWAPEQASGKGKAATVQTDVYGVGAILYACLTGRPPFEGASMLEVVVATRDSAVTPPSHYSEVPRSLEAVLLRCLKKSPEDRFADMLELRAALLKAQEADSGSRPRLGLAIGVTLVALAAGVLLSGLIAFGNPSPPEPDPLLQEVARLEGTSPQNSAELRRAASGIAALTKDPDLLQRLTDWKSSWDLVFRARATLDAWESASALLSKEGLAEPVRAALAQLRARQAAQEEFLRLESAVQGRRLGPGDHAAWSSWKKSAPHAPDLAEAGRRWRRVLIGRLAVEPLAGELSGLVGEELEIGRASLAYLRFIQDEKGSSALRELAEGGTSVATQSFARGFFGAGKQDYRAAVELFARASRESPEFLLAQTGIFMALISAQLNERARVKLDEFVAQFGPDVESHTWNARLLAQEGKVEAAKAAARSALALVGDPIPIGTVTALFYGLFRDAPEFVRKVVLGRAIESRPDSFAFAFMLGTSYELGGQRAKALEVWRRLHARDPSQLKGRLEKSLGSKALARVEAALAKKSAPPEVQSEEFKLKLSRVPNSALNAAKARVRGIKSAEVRARTQRALELLIRGHPWSSAEEDFAAAKALGSEDPYFWFSYARALIGRDRLPQAEAALDAAEKTGSSTSVVLFLRAEVKARLYDLPGQRALLQRILQLKDLKPALKDCVDMLLLRQDGVPGGVEYGALLERVERHAERNALANIVVLRAGVPYPQRFRNAISRHVDLDGWADTLTLTCYLMDRTSQIIERERAGAGGGQAFYREASEIVQRISLLSSGAWTRLATVKLTLRRPPVARMMFPAIRGSLKKALELQPNRLDTPLLKGISALARKQPSDQVAQHFERARELGATPEDFASWSHSYSQIKTDPVLAQFLVKGR